MSVKYGMCIHGGSPTRYGVLDEVFSEFLLGVSRRQNHGLIQMKNRGIWVIYKKKKGHANSEIGLKKMVWV